MHKPLSSCAGLCALAFATQCQADGVFDGVWYASVFGGYATSDLTTTYTTGSYTVDATIEPDGGYILGGTLGMYLGTNIRTEAELSYASYSVGSYSYDVSGPFLNNTTTSDARDNVEVTATYLLGNIWYDFTMLAPNAGLIPYAGGGFGYVILEGTTNDDALFETAQGTAYQIGGGVQVTAGPGMFDLAYRYRGITGAEIITPAFTGDGAGIGHSFQAGYLLTF
mgnify:CR=1 FL=1